MLGIRTPPWETIGFTQTGQRSGELTANSDQVSAQESLGAEVCVSSYFAAAKGLCFILHSFRTLKASPFNIFYVSGFSWLKQ